MMEEKRTSEPKGFFEQKRATEKDHSKKQK